MTIKKWIAAILAAMMLLSFAGCKEQADNDLPNNRGGDESEIVSSDISTGGIGSIDADDEAVIVNGPSSQEVVLAAANKTLDFLKVRNYYDYKLFVEQGEETTDLLRTTLSPGRTEDLPLDKLFDMSTMNYYNVWYYQMPEKKLNGYVYFREYFGLGNGSFGVNVYYLVPGAFESERDVHDKIYAQDRMNRYDLYDYCDYNSSLYENGNVTQLKTGKQDKVWTVSFADNISMSYDFEGKLYSVNILYEDAYIVLSRPDNVNYSSIVENLEGFASYLFNPNTISLATSVLETTVKGTAVEAK
ncbi:MAG: hypothetical protein J6L92_01020 [Clostridia bacterium]|nr:hypothetical protein [Clostridia bacterium]